MTTFLPLLAVVSVVAAGAYLTGRTILGLCNVRWLRRTTPENVLAAACLGTAGWILLSTWCSYCGLTAPQTLPVALVVLGILLSVLAVQRRWFWLLPPAKRNRCLPLLGGFVLAAFVTLASNLMSHSYTLFTDTAFYLTISEWLQIHSIGGVCEADPLQPVLHVRDFMQSGWFRAGALCFLSVIQALFPNFEAMDIYPAVLAWGAMLNVAGIYVLSRWALRLAPWYAAAAALVTLSLSNPLSFSRETGFFCQIYGTAALTFGLAILARLHARQNWHWGSAAAFSLASAMVLGAYNELAPFLAIACCGYLAYGVIRAKRQARLIPFFAFSGQTLLLLALLGNVEFVRTFRSILMTLQMNGVGWNVAWSLSEFWGFALGVKSFGGELKPLAIAATLGGTICLLLGCRRIVMRTRQALPLGIALGVFACLATYYRYGAHDPWTHEVGHTWNQFKLCKWAFPLVAAVEGAGVYVLLQYVPRRRLIITTVCVVCATILIPYRVMRAKRAGALEQATFQSQRPVDSLREFRQQLAAARPDNLYFIANPDDDAPCISNLLPCLLYPHPCLNSWKRGSFIHPAWLKEDHLASATPGTLFFMHGQPPFEPPLAELPAGFSIVDARRVFVFKFSNLPIMIRKPELGPDRWLGREAAKLEVWSPDQRVAVLNLEIHPGPDGPETTQRQIRVSQGDQTQDIIVENGPQVSLPVSLVAGLNSVQIQCMDEPSTDKKSPQLAKISRVSVNERKGRSEDCAGSHGFEQGNQAAISSQ